MDKFINVSAAQSINISSSLRSQILTAFQEKHFEEVHTQLTIASIDISKLQMFTPGSLRAAPELARVSAD